MKKILLVFAHPDDESICSGGTVAKYVRVGWQVDLVCATKGEAGSSGVFTVSGAALGDLRARELKTACALLGINHTTLLDHTDGRLSELTPGTLEDPIYRAMESGLPDVVVTFDPTGISNHPDHIKICRATTYSFQKYAAWLESLKKKFRIYRSHDESWFSRLEGFIAKRMEPKLYYACLPESVVQYLQKRDALPKQSFGKPWVGVPDKNITTIINIGRCITLKVHAIAAHTSQREDFEGELLLTNNPEFLKEFYILHMEGIKEIFMGKNDSVRDRL